MLLEISKGLIYQTLVSGQPLSSGACTALAVIAPGVTPFGDGPDRGREAIFRGRMAYHSVTDPWEGYLVIQDKFR